MAYYKSLIWKKGIIMLFWYIFLNSSLFLKFLGYPVSTESYILCQGTLKCYEIITCAKPNRQGSNRTISSICSKPIKSCNLKPNMCTKFHRLSLKYNIKNVEASWVISKLQFLRHLSRGIKIKMLVRHRVWLRIAHRSSSARFRIITSTLYWTDLAPRLSFKTQCLSSTQAKQAPLGFIIQLVPTGISNQIINRLDITINQWI